jgi:hypothetical protein
MRCILLRMCHVSITTAGFPRSETGGFSAVVLQNTRAEVIANRSGTVWHAVCRCIDHPQEADAMKPIIRSRCRWAAAVAAAVLAHASTTVLAAQPAGGHIAPKFTSPTFKLPASQPAFRAPAMPTQRPAPQPATRAQSPQSRPRQAAPFDKFSPKTSVRWDEKYLYVESNGMPAHPMMVGITSWQQQVPLPQRYTGDNAWRIPLSPVASANPVSIKGRFLRGAIALAANGIPIFNPQNNRGEVAAEIGELDKWGGHCGRADDYHYHIAPVHLQAVLGVDKPVAWALDGYPIYGYTEPDGSPRQPLDAEGGHNHGSWSYHYHAIGSAATGPASPYLPTAFHGTVVNYGGQVDGQPEVQSLRQSGTGGG